MDLALKEKVVVISGCNGGIGEALCKAFLEEGAKVAGLYRGDKSKVQHLYDLVKTHKLKAENFITVSMDIDATSSIETGFKTITDQWGHIDVLVNNAGWTVEKPFLSLEDDEIEMIYSSNLSSLMKLSRAALKIMLARKSGNIVNISSTVAEHHGRGVAVYSAMKSAVNRLTEVLAVEMGKKKIRVNSVCPGVVETRMSNGLQDRHAKLLLEKTPLQRYATPEEVAKSVLFLASEESAAFITGHNLFIDGGIGL
jgi:3-oxoacyl-[acyl-carrier protein] reductase